MSTKIVTYDLGVPETAQSYQKLIGAIKQFFPDSIRPLESFWVLNTSLSCAQVKNYLLPYIDRNDKIFVIDCSLSEWASLGLSQDDLKWLHAH